MVNILLYVSDCIRSPAGVTSSARIITAKMPPSRKKTVMEPR